MIDENKKLEILNDHYNNTFNHIKDYLKLRDKLFIYLVIVVIIVLFQISYPASASENLSSFISEKLGLTEQIDISFLGTVIWFIFLALCIRYFQTVVHIERQYKYIRKIEDNLSEFYKNEVFTREGKSYLTNYPFFSNWTWIIYSIIYPLLLTLISFLKIITEYQSFTLHFLINLIIFISVILSILGYILLLHFKK